MTKDIYKLRLQLFADQVINATSSASEGNDLSAEMKTFYDKTLITLASPYLVHDQFGQKRDIPKNGGRVIEFRKFSALPKITKPLVEGVTPAGNKLDVTSVTATVEQYGDYVEQTDFLELTAVDNTVVEATKQLAAQAGATIDTIVKNELSGGTNVMYSPYIYNEEEVDVYDRCEVNPLCHLRVKDVFMAAAQLKAMNAPKIDGYYVGIIHPYVAYDLMQEAGSQWLDVQKYASPENILTGEIGCLGGVRFVESTEAKIFKGDPFDEETYTLTIGSTLEEAGKTLTLSTDVSSTLAEALVGRKIVLEGLTYTIKSATAGTGGTAKITVSDDDDNISTTDGKKDNTIYPAGGGENNSPVFSTLILGADAYGVTSIAGGGIEHIVKQRGYGDDPLNQRSSVGWKAFKAAKRLVEEYMIRIESGSTFYESVEAN